MNKRTYVGLDVHARSVKGCAIDRETCEILRQSLAASDAGIAEWVSGLPGPVLVVYEAGPTGFGLARLLAAATSRGSRSSAICGSRTIPCPSARARTTRHRCW
jgi:hypothetical protein